MKLHSDKQLDEAWDESLVGALHADIVADFLRCDTEHSLKATIEYVKFLNHKGIDKENYPYYMNLFLHENEKVIQAFLADGRILNSLKKLQRSTRLIELCFELLKRFIPNQVYEKTIETLFTILQMNYRNASSGFMVFPLEIEHLNYIGKYLDKNKPQNSRINRLILDILADIGDLNSKDVEDPVLFEISARANRIRNVFFDKRVSMLEILPPMMLPK